jgi:hypothetical protein
MKTISGIPLILLGAVLIGVGCSVFFMLVFKGGQIPPQARLFDFWIPLVVLFFMLILIRARKEERIFHFWEGLMAGNLMLWLGGFFSGVLIYLFSELSPEFFQNFISSSVRYLVESDRFAAPSLKIKDLAGQVARLKAMKAESLIWDEFIKKLYYSFLLVPFVSVILRRK